MRLRQGTAGDDHFIIFTPGLGLRLVHLTLLDGTVLGVWVGGAGGGSCSPTHTAWVKVHIHWLGVGVDALVFLLLVE